MNETLNYMRRQLVQPGNIDLNNRPVTINPDGSYSTVESFSFQDDDGTETLIPMVAPSGQMWPSQEDAIRWYKMSGQHLGKFTTPFAANLYAQSLHDAQAKQYAQEAARKKIAAALMKK